MAKEDSAEKVKRITEAVSAKFPVFGGGQAVPGNPIAAALKDKPAQFAAGVSVEDVVRTVLQEA